MEYKNLLVFFLLGIVTVCSALTVQLRGGAKRIEKVGASTSLTCELDQGLAVILEYTVEWVHVPITNAKQRQPQERMEQVMTRQKTLTDLASPDSYVIDVNYDADTCVFTLTFKELQPSDDGFFICRATSNQNKDDKTEAMAEIIVVSDVQELALQFDGEESVRELSRVPVMKEEGKYGVSCTATGSNPDATVRMFLGQEELKTGGASVNRDWPASRAAGGRRFSTTVTASHLHLKGQHTNEQLRCTAVANFEGAVPVTVGVNLTIITFEPDIKCDKNVTARVGQKYVRISCEVTHINVDVERFLWEIGNTGEIIEPNINNMHYNQVDVEEVGEDTTIVTLDLFQVNDSHFNTYYYLEVFTSNGRFREEAELIKLKDKKTNSSTRTSAAVLVCILSLIFSLLNCLV